MKLLFFDDWKLGVLKGDSVVDVSAVVTAIPHTGPHDLISGLDRALRRPQGAPRGGGHTGQGVPVEPGPDPAAAAEARQHRGDGRELHGGRHALGARAHQRVSQVAQRRHRSRRHHGAARRARHHLRGRGRDGRDHRQARLERPRRGRHELHLRLLQLHRRLRPWPAARRQHVLPDEVARHLRADRPVPRHRRRDRGSAPSRHPPLGQRRAQAELQHQRHGPQDPTLHRVGDLDPHARAGRHPRHGHEPPRPQRLPERRRGRARDAGAGPAALRRAGRPQAHLGAGDAPRSPEQGARGDDAAAQRQALRRPRRGPPERDTAAPA